MFDKAKGTHVLVEVGKTDRRVHGHRHRRGYGDADRRGRATDRAGRTRSELARQWPSWCAKPVAKAVAKAANAAPEDPYASEAPIDPYGDDGVRSAEAPAGPAPSATAAPISAGEGGVRTAEAPTGGATDHGSQRRSAGDAGEDRRDRGDSGIDDSDGSVDGGAYRHVAVAVMSTTTPTPTPIVSAAAPVEAPVEAPRPSRLRRWIIRRVRRGRRRRRRPSIGRRRQSRACSPTRSPMRSPPRPRRQDQELESQGREDRERVGGWNAGRCHDAGDRRAAPRTMARRSSRRRMSPPHSATSARSRARCVARSARVVSTSMPSPPDSLFAKAGLQAGDVDHHGRRPAAALARRRGEPLRARRRRGTSRRSRSLRAGKPHDARCDPGDP